MRELKFRVWNANEEEFLSELEFLIGPKGEIFPVHEHWDGFEIETDNDMSDSGWVLLQYTGLKDKNGKEIYEGDIILFNNFGDTLDKVVYSPGCFHTSRGGYLLDKIREIEVIGNIYENPELLEEKRTLSKRWFTE